MNIAVVIPAYEVKDQILSVLSEIDDTVSHIIVVDDNCPQKTGEWVEKNVHDKRLIVLYHKKNRGVGGAVKTGFKKALELAADIVVKIDGDGQMDAKFIPTLIEPIIQGRSDFTKGNRFFFLSELKKMPFFRLTGNSILSFINKIVNGYWNVMDPTNGFIAVHTSCLSLISIEKLSDRYFFESDLLFRMGTIRAVVTDIPMAPKYENETSNLSVIKALFEFPPKYAIRFFKRLFYQYFLRDFNIGSLELIFGFLLFSFGVIFGALKWHHALATDIPTPTGTVMLSVLPIILGFQLLLSFITFDMASLPKSPIHLAFPNSKS
jgi:glycosyltransferase involved in cell wall biosynthesis